MIHFSECSLTVFAVAAVVISACQTAGTSMPVSQGDERLQARWPIHNLNGYDPYPIAASARIDAFVDFGRGDGLLRFSLGCGVFSMPYEITQNSRLSLPDGAETIRPDQSALNCDAEVARRNLELVELMEGKPRIAFEDSFMFTLRSGRTVLELNSVEFVLSK